MRIELLVVMALFAIWLWRKRGGKIPKMSNPLSGASLPNWKVKEEHLKRVAVAIFTLLLLNLAFWAGMNQFQKDWGNSYFWDTWMLSPAFILLAAITILLGLGGENDNKQFGIFRTTIAGIALLTVFVGVFPGFWGPEKAPSSSSGVAGTGTTVIGMPAKLTFDPADSIPAESSELIEEVFNGLPDSTIQVMKRIAYAESRGMHWKTGTTNQVLQGIENPRDMGLFQINDSLHGRKCEEAGFDLMEVEGNARCARMLYDERDTRDWYLSAWMWRDRYEEKPANWFFSRTPQALAQGASSGREVIFVDAPVTGESERVYTHNRKYCYDVVGEIVDTPYLVRDDVGTVDTIVPGKYITHTRYARWYTFQSLGADELKIAFVKSPPGVLECNVGI